MKKTDLMPATKIAFRQAGMISRRQAIESGLTPSVIHRLVRDGLWMKILPGVYELPAAHDIDRWRQLAHAALLWSRDGVLSFRSAGALHDFPLRPGHIDITVSRKVSSPVGWLRVHHAVLEADEQTRVRGLRATSCARTLVDLVRVLDRDQMEAVLDAALMRGSVSLRKMTAVVTRAQGRGQVGIALLRDLLEERAGQPPIKFSELEKLFKRVCRMGRLPEPIAQFPVDLGGSTAYIDFAYPHHMLAIECDSVEYHAGASAWRRDLQRQNRLSELGWAIGRVTWRQLKEDPQGVVEMVANLLAVRSAAGGYASPAAETGVSRRVRGRLA